MLAHREVVVDADGFRHHAEPRSRRDRLLRDLDAVHLDPAGVRATRPVIDLIVVVLPAPLGPSKP